ncbi:MAG: TetR/AcrR family transcriptional regulator [Solirubrobacteraceae bacterium]
MSDDADFQPRRRLTQAEAREHTRALLLAAAARVFAQKGFAGASLEEIAELAGYTTGALYYHFASKDQLFLELLRTGSSQHIAELAAAPTSVFGDANADPFDALAAFLVDRSDDRLEPLGGEFWLYALRNPDCMAILAERFRKRDEALEPTITNLMDRARTPPGITPNELTTVTVELLDTLVRRRQIDPDSVPDDLPARVLRRLFAIEPEHGSRPPATWSTSPANE